MVSAITSIFYFPNISAKQLSGVLSMPETEAELKLAKAVLTLSKNIEENDGIMHGNSNFDATKNAGHDYLEYGTQIVLETMKELYAKYDTTSEEGYISYINDLKNTIIDVANDARIEKTENYHKICFDANLLLIEEHKRSLLESLTTNDEVVRFLTESSSLTSAFMVISENISYLTQVLFIGDRSNTSGSKIDLTENDLELACKFVKGFDDYIKSLQSFTRN